MADPTIQILPEHVANQIAAGEVVQRPQSVVKELVENAIDAGATSVSVFIRDGGKRSIRILDNGSGIQEQDLPRVLLRHATSKISTTQDLYALSSLGFRGEALASIASVADIEIRTRRQDQRIGWKLVSSPGNEPTIEPVKADQGTEILVKNLFYSVPARKKFLKSDLTEMKHIADTMKSIAMCHAEIRFVLYDNDKLVFDVEPTSQAERLAAIVGEEYIAASKEVTRAAAGVTVQGWIGLPEVASKKRKQYVFLNGRTIVHKGLAHAVYSAMEHILNAGQFPFFVLFLQVDPAEVDVNVHPQKHEVKFEREREVYNAVYYATGDAIRAAGISQTQHSANPAAPFVAIETDGKPGLLNTTTGELLEQKPMSFSPPRFNSDKKTFGSAYRATPEERAPSQEALSKLFGQPESPSDATQHSAAILYFKTDGNMLVEVSPTGCRMLHATKAIKLLRSNHVLMHSKVPQQQLLFPEQVALNEEQASFWQHEELQACGFSLARLGDTSTFEVTAIPELVDGFSEQLVRNLLDALIQAVESERNTKGIGVSVLQQYLLNAPVKLDTTNSQVIKSVFMDFDKQQTSGLNVPFVVELSWSDFEQRFG